MSNCISPNSLALMSIGRLSMLLAVLVVVAVLLLVASLSIKHFPAVSSVSPQDTEHVATPASNAPVTGVSKPQPTSLTGVRHRASALSPDQMQEFRKKFEARYKPAIRKWAHAYQNHLPFSVDAISADTFVERIGRDPSYNEYVFVVNRITLGVADHNGEARVDYLNDPSATAKLGALPPNAPTPILQIPVTQAEVGLMLKADSGNAAEETNIHMIATGVSGALNGGVNVIVGGDVNNFLSWSYNIVFGPDGKMVYYLKGQQ